MKRERTNASSQLQKIGLILLTCLFTFTSRGDEQTLGYVRGAETLPQGANSALMWNTWRSDKGAGEYDAIDTELELERGITDRFSASASFKLLSIDVSGLEVDGYLPKDEQYTLNPSGAEVAGKYMFLAPAKDPVGLAVYFALNYDWLDPHSGQDKDTIYVENELILQKYFLDGQLIWLVNAGYEATYADRAEISDLPEGFEWPTDPEMEIELNGSTGLSYRFAPKWFIGAEALYQTEFETEVGQERWTFFAGPTLHYGAEKWWATLSWSPQIVGGGEQFDEQDDKDLHLIEKTKDEVRLKIGYNF